MTMFSWRMAKPSFAHSSGNERRVVVVEASDAGTGHIEKIHLFKLHTLFFTQEMPRAAYIGGPLARRSRQKCEGRLKRRPYWTE